MVQTDDKKQLLDQDSYTKSTLGPTQNMRTLEQKILGVCWNIVTDLILFDVKDIADAAD